LSGLISDRLTSITSASTLATPSSVASATVSPAVYVKQQNAAVNVPVQHASNSTTAGINSGIWVQTSYYNSAQDDERDVINSEYDADTQSFALGYDVALDDTTLVGISASYSDIEIDQLRTARDETEIDALQITAYALRQFGALQVNGQIGYISGDADTSRTAAGEEISGSYDVDGFNLQVGANYTYKLGKTGYFSPLVSFQYADISQDSYTETGGLNLTVGGIDNDYFEGKLGFRVGEKIVSPSSITDLFFSAAVVSDFGSGPDDVSINFADQTSSLSVFDADDERIEIGLGINWYSSDNHSFGASVNGEFSDDFYTVGGQVQYKYSF